MPPVILTFKPPFLNFGIGADAPDMRKGLREALEYRGEEMYRGKMATQIHSSYSYKDSQLHITLDNSGALNLGIALEKAAKEIPPFMDSIKEDFNCIKEVIVHIPDSLLGTMYGWPVKTFQGGSGS